MAVDFHLLRRIRSAAARFLGVVLAAAPGLEPVFIRTGRWAASHSRWLGSLYWHAQDDLLRRLRLSGNRFRKVNAGGIELITDVAGSIARMHYFYDEPYEPELSQAIRDRLHSGDVFIDIGANTGYFTMLAARLVGPSGRVVAFEPNPAAVDLLRRAAALNRVSAIVDIQQAAVGAQVGHASLFLSDDSVLSTMDPERAPSRDQFAFPDAIDVPTLTLDDWLGKHAALAARLRAIKIDVEGTEGDVVAGMAAMVGRCPDLVIFCETSPGSPADLRLRAHGHRATPLDSRRGEFGNYAYARGIDVYTRF